MGEHLLFKLEPSASGDDSHLDDTEQVMEKRRHLSIERRFACGERSVKIKDNQLLHHSSTSVFMQSQSIWAARSPTSSLHCWGEIHMRQPPPAKATLRFY